MRKFFLILTVVTGLAFGVTLACVSSGPKQKELSVSAQLDEIPTGEEKVETIKAITEHLDQLSVAKEKTALEFRFTPAQAMTVKGVWLRELITHESIKRNFVVVTGTKRIADELLVVIQVFNPINSAI